MKMCYICHPITSGEFSVRTNLESIGMIRRCYVEMGLIPIVPSDIMRYVFPTSGDQSRAYGFSINIMLRCDEVHVFDGWRKSGGCIREVDMAHKHKMPVQMCDANKVRDELRLMKEEYDATGRTDR